MNNDVIILDNLTEDELRKVALKSISIVKENPRGHFFITVSDPSSSELDQQRKIDGEMIKKDETLPDEVLLRQKALDSLRNQQRDKETSERKRFIITLETSDSESDSFEPKNRKETIEGHRKKKLLSEMRQSQYIKLLKEKEVQSSLVNSLKKSLNNHEKQIGLCSQEISKHSRLIKELRKEVISAESKLKSLLSSRKSQRFLLISQRKRLKLAEQRLKDSILSCERSESLYLQSIREESTLIRTLDYLKLQRHSLCNTIEYLTATRLKNWIVNTLCRKKNDSYFQNKTLVSVSSKSEFATVLESATKFCSNNVSQILCPFEIDGKCLDDNCSYTHNAKSKSAVFRLPSLSFDRSMCQICQKSLNILSKSKSDKNLRTWHRAFLKYSKNSDIDSLKTLKTCLAESSNSSSPESLSIHHLFAQILDISTSIVDSKVSILYSFISAQKFPTNLTSFFVTSVSIDFPIRKALFTKLRNELICEILMSNNELETHRLCVTLFKIICQNTCSGLDDLVMWLESCLKLDRMNYINDHPIVLYLMYALILARLKILPRDTDLEDMPYLTKAQIMEVQIVLLDFRVTALDRCLHFYQSYPFGCPLIPLAMCNLYCQYLTVCNQAPMAVDILSRISSVEVSRHRFEGVFVFSSFFCEEKYSLQPSGLSFNFPDGCVRALLAWSHDNTARCMTIITNICSRLIPEYYGDSIHIVRHLLGLETIPLHGIEGFTQIPDNHQLYLWLIYFLLARIQISNREIIDIDQLVQNFLNNGLNTLKNSDALCARLFGMFTIKFLDLGLNDFIYYQFLYNFLIEESPTVLTLNPKSPWVLELLQNIRLQRIMYRPEFSKFLFSLVEMYGFVVIPSLCSNLIIIQEFLLAMKLCNILRSEQLSNPHYWELFFSIWLYVNVLPEQEAKKEKLNIFLAQAVEFLYEALNCAPNSENLWFYMANLTNYSLLKSWKSEVRNLARNFHKLEFLEEVWNKDRNFFTKTPSRN